MTLAITGGAPGQAVHREGDDHGGEDRLDDRLGDRGQQQQAERDAEHGGADEPPGAADVDLPPVLDQDAPGDRDRDEGGHRGGRCQY
jgi:hypothetical protein